MAGAITGEFLGGGKGFGELIRVASTNLHTARALSLIIYLSIIGLAVFMFVVWAQRRFVFWQKRSEEHTSELQSLMRTSYADFCMTNNKLITLPKQQHRPKTLSQYPPHQSHQ